MSAELARFIIVCHVDAPRERVFRAWTDPEQARRWLESAAVAFHEIVAPRRLVLTTGDDPNGPGAPIAAVVFADRGDRTEITLAASAPEEQADELEEDWTRLFDRLATSLARSPAEQVHELVDRQLDLPAAVGGA